MIAVPEKFQDKICVSAKVYIDNGKKVLKHLPKSWQLAKESVLDDSKGQNNLVLLTGPVNDIICFDIDCMDFWELHKGMFLGTTYMEESFSGKIHLYYKYTPVLKSKKCGQFDILSTSCSAILGTPMNDLPINEMSSELIEFINVDLLNKNYKDNSKIVSLISKDYVRSKSNWITVGKFLKLTGCRYDDWVLVSMKDRNGFSKNFDENGVNCMKAMWKSFHNTKKFIDTFNELVRKLAEHHKKNKSIEKIAAKEKEINEFAPGLEHKHLQNGYKFQQFVGGLISKIAKRLKDDNMLEYLLENELITSSDYKVKFIRSNHFDVNDDFYFNDFRKMLTKQGKTYRNGEVLLIISKNLHRVLAYAKGVLFVKLSKNDPNLMTKMNYLSTFFMFIPNINRYSESTNFLEYITKKEPFIFDEICFNDMEINFDSRCEIADTFYATRKFVSKPVDSGTDISFLMTFIKEIICDNSEINFLYFMQWLSFMYYSPNDKPLIAMILFSEEQGTGKSSLVKFLSDFIFGQDNSIENISWENLMGHKQLVTLNKKLICCNEISSVHSRKASNECALKSLITEDIQFINRMCKETLQCKTAYGLIFCSNNKACLKIEPSDRRFFPMQVSAAKKQNAVYFKELFETSFNQVVGNQFAHELSKYRSEFRTLLKPITDLKQEMIEESDYQNPFWVALYNGEIDISVEKIVSKEDYQIFDRRTLYAKYVDFCKEGNYAINNKHRFESLGKKAGHLIEYRTKVSRQLIACHSSKFQMETMDAIDKVELDDE